MTMSSFKQVESNYVKPCEQSFVIVWILDTVNMVLSFQFELKMAVHAAHTKKNICEVSNFWYLFKKI